MRSKASSRRAKPSRAAASIVRWRCRRPEETEARGRRIGRALRGGEVLALRGELGAGKTTLIRGIAAGLDAHPDRVSSPTFVFVHLYEGRLPLTHVDLYRLGEHGALADLGLEDYLDGRTVVAIEWADYAEPWLPTDRLDIELRHAGPNAPTERAMTVQAHGERARAALKRIAR